MQSESLTYFLYVVIMTTTNGLCMPDKITVQLASVGLTQTCPNQSVTQTSQTVVTVMTVVTMETTHIELMLHCQQMNR